MNLSDLKEIESLLKRHGFHFSKSLGQNFLIDPEVCPAMAEAAIPDSSYGVLEIGPGIGVLTVELAKRAKKVVSIELDSALFPILEETLAGFPNVSVIAGDAMKLNLTELISKEFPGMPVVLCANLPYYITSPILTKLLKDRVPVENITVMVQKEAAERLCADMGTRKAGAVTAAICFYAEAEELFKVPKESFVPSPKVESEVIQLRLREQPVAELKNEEAFFNMVKAGFTQRRKTVLNSLTGPLSVNKERLRLLFAELGIPENARMEELTLEQLIALYKAAKE